jgi:16S rRNA (cytosine967-C5)-methyltransferase
MDALIFSNQAWCLMQHRNARVQAADFIAQVMQGHSLTALLQSCAHPEKSFIQALCFGVLRQIESLQWILKKLLQKPLPKSAKTIEALILIGLYQLQDEHTVDHAAINETVKAVGETKQASFKGLTNAILRRYQRERVEWDKALALDEARFDCPRWLLNEFKKSWPNDWQKICMAQQEKPPFSLRVNLSKTTREQFINECIAAQHAVPMAAASCILLDQACDVHQLPGFEKAMVTVQDQAGQFIPSLVTLKPNMRILDACSAPGSKLTHLFEICPNAEFTAIEIDEHRIKRLEDNLARHQMQARIFHADASDLASWWDKQPFDLILLDAPCSATGVIRRHPDIKLLRQTSDIDALQAIQRQLLETLWSTLKPGGQLLYTTCSVLPQENDKVMEAFTQARGLVTQPLTLPVGRRTQYGWQILPGEGECDGFYYGLLA